MGVSIQKAKTFIYENGSLWEKALFRYLFEDRPIEDVLKIFSCYKNEDGGFGHSLEYDIKCPSSHPLALEFLLTIFRDLEINQTGDLFDGTVSWVENNRVDNGSLKNPENLLQYPHAPWWSDGGQTAPDSITGNLIRLGLCTESLKQSTKQWVEENLKVEDIGSTEWLFMNYHAYDYFFNTEDTKGTETLLEATINQIIACTENAPTKQYSTFFQFSPSPQAVLAKRIGEERLEKMLTYLENSQREDGGWDDEHGLTYWQPYLTVRILYILKQFGRLSF
jgi:hypothetical protein